MLEELNYIYLILTLMQIFQNIEKLPKLYMVGDREMRIQQEIILGQAGVAMLKALGYNPTIYHMNEGHSSFLILELIYNLMKEKQISFQIARDIVSAKTVFTTHTPVPAGNDIFELSLVEKIL